MSTAASPNWRIILAEDEPDVRGFLVRALSRIYPASTIVAVANGALALDLLKQQPVDMIISDHRMPVMTGLELLQAVRSMPAASGLPFILISADITVEASAMAAGASAVLFKPFSLTQLRNLVTRFLPS